MDITKTRINKLIDGLNHRLSKVESDLKWIRWIGYYMASILTLVLIGGNI